MTEHSYAELYYAARRVITELKRQISAQSIYIRALEKQLEPGVIEEVRDELISKQSVEDLHEKWVQEP